jgi:hypothetical protein
MDPGNFIKRRRISMKTIWAAGTITFGLLGMALPILAHHSFMAEFNPTQPVTLDGVVTKVEWMNPHTFFYVDVQDKNGQVVNWKLETGTPSQLSMRGWTRDSLKDGDHITVTGYRARNGSNRAATRQVKFADGRSLLTGRTDGMDYDGPAGK